MKKAILHSGGMDSTAIMMDYISKYGNKNLISLGFNYGQRHFNKENDAATRFCAKYDIVRKILNIDLGQIGGSSLTDHTMDVTTDMNDQRSTVVPQRNAMFIIMAAAFAEVNDCDTIVHGAIKEDFVAYRDCRPDFFKFLEMTIQAGRTQPIHGNEDISMDICTAGDVCNNKIRVTTYIPKGKLDIRIETPLIDEKKEDTVKRIIDKYGVEPYKYSYTCYNGVEPQCGQCPADVERQIAFYINKIEDPIPYKNPLTKIELDKIIQK